MLGLPEGKTKIYVPEIQVSLNQFCLNTQPLQFTEYLERTKAGWKVLFCATPAERCKNQNECVVRDPDCALAHSGLKRRGDFFLRIPRVSKYVNIVSHMRFCEDFAGSLQSL